MNDKAIVRAAMEAGNVTQKELATALGWSSQQAVGNKLTKDNKNSMRVDNFVKMLDAMGYKVVVQKKIGTSEEWVVEF